MTAKNNPERVEAESSSNDRHPFGWLLFIVAFFPLIALLTYDPGVYSRIPAPPSANWFGMLGDAFAHYAGYQAFGLAAWIIPVLCITSGIRAVLGRRVRPGRRMAWSLGLLMLAACLVQILSHHAPGIAAICRSFNIERSAGGICGYFLAELGLSRLLSDIGASVLLLALMGVAFVAAIGRANIAAFFAMLGRWAVGAPRAPEDAAGTASGAQSEAIAAYMAARKAARQARSAPGPAVAVAAGAPYNPPPEPAAPPPPARREKSAPPPEPAAAAAATPAAPPSSGPYVLPGPDLLAPLRPSAADCSNTAETSVKLVDTLKLFGIDASVAYTVTGPVVTKYAILLAPGTRYNVVTNIQSNIKGALRAKSLRIEAPIPGDECIGIEVPNRKPAGITFREIYESDAWQRSDARLPLLFGKRADGEILVADLASMPHMLVAGATGQGKSVCLNSLISGLLMCRTPEQLRLIMVDPKCVEFTPYAAIPHLLVPVITDNKKVVFSLHWAVAEMEKRLKIFARARVRNIDDYNHRQKITQPDMFGGEAAGGGDDEMPATMPYIVIIIDEAADLIGQCGKEVNPDIQRITQKARAAGIHLILATQRPDAKIITGVIKSNIPGRVAFKTSSPIDSRTILDESGAENLIGRGDMLFRGKDNVLVRAQGAWISDEEIANITRFIGEHSVQRFDEKFAEKLSRVKEAPVEDPFASNEDDPDNQSAPAARAAERERVKAAANADDFKKAVECVINTKRASTSHFQRELGWGYNHAAKILDQLAKRGIVSELQGMGARQIVMDQDQLIAILNGDGEAGAAAGAATGAAPDEAGDDFQPTTPADDPGAIEETP